LPGSGACCHERAAAGSVVTTGAGCFLVALVDLYYGSAE
jgi:hypothetical protein